MPTPNFLLHEPQRMSVKGFSDMGTSLSNMYAQQIMWRAKLYPACAQVAGLRWYCRLVLHVRGLAGVVAPYQVARLFC